MPSHAVLRWAVTNLPTTAWPSPSSSPSSSHSRTTPSPSPLFNLFFPCCSSRLSLILHSSETQCPLGSSSSPPYDPRSSSSTGPLITISTGSSHPLHPVCPLTSPTRHVDIDIFDRKKHSRPCGLSSPLTPHSSAPRSSRRPVIGHQPLARHLGSGVTRPIAVAIARWTSTSPPLTRSCPTRFRFVVSLIGPVRDFASATIELEVRTVCPSTCFHQHPPASVLAPCGQGRL